MTALGTSELDAAALAQRALVAGLVLGVLGRTAREVRSARVLVGALETLATAEPADVDLVVMVDAGVVEEGDLPSALAGVRRVLGEGAAVALLVGSSVTRAFVQDARNPTPSPPAPREDAYALARRWAAPRSAARLAPGLDGDRFTRIVEAASAADLTLVEADVATVAPGLARVRGVKTSRGRALLTTMALGAAARALLFVPSGRAPKGGLARAKVERLADAWVSAGAARGGAHPSGLVSSALRVLDERASASPTPIGFDALLREARERWTSTARASGGRATPSAKDSADLASALYRLAADERVDLHAVDPESPTWVLTIAS